MRRTVKAALVLVTLSLCVLGAVFSPTENQPDREQRAHLVPVNNHSAQRGIWLRV